MSIRFFPTVGSFIGLSLCPKRFHLLKFEGGIVIVMRSSILCLLNWFDSMNWMSKSTDSVSPGGIETSKLHHINHVKSHSMQSLLACLYDHYHFFLCFLLLSFILMNQSCSGLCNQVLTHNYLLNWSGSVQLVDFINKHHNGSFTWFICWSVLGFFFLFL